MVFRYCLVLLLTVGAAGMDLRTQKISNIWLCCGWLSGLGHQFLTDQIRGLGSFAAGEFSAGGASVDPVSLPHDRRRRYKAFICAGRHHGSFRIF